MKLQSHKFIGCKYAVYRVESNLFNTQIRMFTPLKTLYFLSRTPILQ